MNWFLKITLKFRPEIWRRFFLILFFRVNDVIDEQEIKGVFHILFTLTREPPNRNCDAKLVNGETSHLTDCFGASNNNNIIEMVFSFVQCQNGEPHR